jgi:vanillate O-demethylase monooxygenase subunit
MSFIRNTWYPALWASELAPQGPKMPIKPVSRKICGEEIVFYRSMETMQIVALEDICPHRFAPLSYGHVNGDSIVCRYHGLAFDSDGNCSHNPAGGNPPKMCAKKYHVQQNEELVYIWIGDGEPTQPAPDLTGTGMREGYGGALYGFLEAPVSWRLMMDNLNDDAHATHLHTLLNSDGHSGRNQEYELKQDELAPDTITQYIKLKNTTCIPLLHKMVKDPTARVDQLLRIHWTVPGNMNITTGVYAPDGDPETQVGVDSMHMITPADENSCYYFWCFKRNGDLENHTFTQKMAGMLAHIFETEDVWVAKGQTARMAGREFWSMQPALLPQDKAAVLVRRRVDKLIEKTNEGGAATLQDEG